MKTALRYGWIFLCLVLALTARCWNIRDVFVQGHIYFTDGDCYSRMTRARMIAEHPGMIIRHHDFENFPQGVHSHATSPLDYLIVGLKGVFDLFFGILDPQHVSLLHPQTLDLAGALISPLLGVAGALFLAWWVERFRVRFGSAALLFYAVCPILVHGTQLGRPDHQSLLMTLLTIAFGAELALASAAKQPTVAAVSDRRGEESDADVSAAGDRRYSEELSPASARRWGILSGIAWGLSLWVSLYEPLILLVVVVALWLALDRRSFLSRARVPGAIACGVILLLALLLEGWPVALPDAAIRDYFSNWERSIGELSHLRPTQLFEWIGWWSVASVILLGLAWRSDRRALPLLVMLILTAALSLWQARWGYFLGIAFAWTLPWQMQALRRNWAAWLFFIAGWWPIMEDWDHRLFLEDEVQDQRNMKQVELVALRDLSEKAIGAHGGAFLASWWLSPAIAYWSHQPGVAGTSHESLSGIVDSARFFLSNDPAAAAAILRQRQVRWVVADDDSHEIETSRTLLGVKPPEKPLASVLADHPEDAPNYLAEWEGLAIVRADGLRFYRLYEVDNAKLPP